MEVRGILRNNTVSSLNRKSLGKNTLKPIKNKNEEEQKPESSPFHKHHAYQYLRGTSPAHNDYKKFVTLLYKGLFYSVNNLKGPSQEYIKKKGVKLPEPTGTDCSSQKAKRNFWFWTLTKRLSTPSSTRKKKQMWCMCTKEMNSSSTSDHTSLNSWQT